MGALIALAVVQVLPFAWQLAHGAKLTLTITRVFGFVLVVLIFIGVIMAGLRHPRGAEIPVMHQKSG